MSDPAWAPHSCTLPTEKRPLRMAEWDALFAGRLTSLSKPEPLWLHVELAAGQGVETQVRDLVDREGGCCSFFSFTVTPGEAAIGLDIHVDPAHEAVLEALAARTAAGGPQ
ncbi:hypothetical protein ACWGIN_01495 [Streptomyces sp. NPDC054861]